MSMHHLLLFVSLDASSVAICTLFLTKNALVLLLLGHPCPARLQAFVVPDSLANEKNHSILR
ncbi:hypothetical protein CBOM_07679 [Ceraceosorus bombacis]|uniref:Uncharacterized protein n=1 Tax=Ceraceosorus bombacis TaxID=401625 RepID=A0A0P1BM47_9BASI|nr:hypothetical protein CBOM_07679 [Ceraceosorus bombacis]